MSSRRIQRFVAGAPCSLRTGLTLLELLLVMAILGVILGGGLGLFASLDLGRRQAVGLVKNVLRSASNSSLSSEASSVVRIDLQTGTLRAEALRVVGTWHFEDSAVKGAFGLDGGISGGARFITDGFLGDALHFDGSPGSMAEVPVHFDPAYDFTNGFSIECVVRKDGVGSGKLLQIGQACSLLINAAGQIQGRFTPRVEREGREHSGQDVVVETEPGMLPPDRWTRIRFSYDRRRLLIFVNGVAVAEADETAPVWPVEGALLISDRNRPFSGSIDSLVIHAVAAEEIAELPPGVVFTQTTPTEVRFDAGGGLDRAVHQEPQSIEIEYDDGSRTRIVVGLYGTVE